jgi:hypothetical protein
MRRFVPGVDSYLGGGSPESLMRFADPNAEDAEGGQLASVGDISLILEKPVTLIEKYRQLCYWRQVVHAENN